MRIPILSLFLTTAFSGSLAAQCPAIVNCPQGNTVICDISGNDPLFWNEPPFTWSQLLETADLYEGTADISVKVVKCAGAPPVISFTLFLDLDNDNLQETVVSSNALPPPGIVFANNAFNPGYTGGDLVVFDKRAIPDTSKFRFALETSAFGDTAYASVRWASGSQYLQPRLPEGRHRIVWRVEQAGKVKFCDYSFRIKDCLDPNIACKSGVAAAIGAGGKATLTFNDAVEMVEDNITPYNLLQLSMRKGDGVGFPLDGGNPVGQLTYNCNETGTHQIELWAKDRLGNVKSCETSVTVTDAAGFCHTLPVICAHPCWGDTSTITGVKYKVVWVDTAQKLISLPLPLVAGGCGELDTLPPAASFSLVPEKDTNALNGVSTFDMVLITRHILGLQPFGAPWQWIAADVNRSNSITTFDVIEIRKLILGIYSKFPGNTSWRFFTADCEFPANPFSGYCPSEASFVSMPLWNYPSPILFNGVKTGDVNGTAAPAPLTSNAPETRGEPATLVLPDLFLHAGESAEISVRMTEAGDWLGFQFELHFNSQKLVVETVATGRLPGFDENSIAWRPPGTLAVSWYAGLPCAILPDENLLTVRVRALEDTRLGDAVALAAERIRPETYTADETARPLELGFDSRTAPESPTVILPAQPNPTDQGISIPLRLMQPETVLTEVTDMSGKICYRDETPLEAGAHLIQAPASAFPHAGVYAWRVRAGAAAASGRIVRL